MRKMAGPTNAKRSKCVCVTFILFLVAAVGYSAAESEDISENSEGVDHTGTCNAGEFTCANGQCIVSDWLCDSESDCVDNTDEDKDLCANVSCSTDHFSCGDGGKCIPLAWRCDGHPDCPNGFDEEDCDLSRCKDSEFQCKEIRRCISNRWHCDQDIDCDDGSDEIGCTPQPCKEQEFRCSNGRCVPLQWHCDGDVDCGDGSDEIACNSSMVTGGQRCASQEFQCATVSDCIHIAWKCDGDNDCHDHSDEDPDMCGAAMACDPGQFQCLRNFSCIAISLRCDSVPDCADGSDEEGCVTGAGCNTQMEFDCSGSGQHCVALERLCDGMDDCGNRADEGSFCTASANPCKGVGAGRCSHECVSTGTSSFICKCPAGFRLGGDNRTCEDVNECLIPGMCSQDCENRKPGYKCKCRPGYELDLNEHRCKAAGLEPILLFANRHDLREIRLHTGQYRSVVEKLHSAIALEYDYRDNYIYWSDVASETISRRAINSSSRTEDLVKRDISTPDGLALDWVHKNLYWTDTGNNRIEVLSVRDPDNFWRKVVVNTNLDEPRAIVVDPRVNQWFIYWSDWGDVPKIERANLDGSERTIIVDQDIQWPNGLAIDYESNLLFWVDAKLHVICSSNLLGGDRRVILTSYVYLKHPFALTVFEDEIYWSDWEVESILKVSKFPKERRNNTVKNVAMHLYSPMDVHVYHELKQPPALDLCDGSGCSHLCLPRRGAPRFFCVCSDYGDVYFLADDRKTCISNSTLTTQASTKLVQGTTKVKSGKGSMIQEGRQGHVSSGDGVAAIVIGVILVVGLIIFVVTCIVYRSYRRKTLKSLNFDNPVYRRTTEDQVTIQRNHFQQPKTLSSLLEPLTSSNEYV